MAALCLVKQKTRTHVSWSSKLIGLQAQTSHWRQQHRSGAEAPFEVLGVRDCVNGSAVGWQIFVIGLLLFLLHSMGRSLEHCSSFQPSLRTSPSAVLLPGPRRSWTWSVSLPHSSPSASLSRHHDIHHHHHRHCHLTVTIIIITWLERCVWRWQCLGLLSDWTVIVSLNFSTTEHTQHMQTQSTHANTSLWASTCDPALSVVLFNF